MVQSFPCHFHGKSGSLQLSVFSFLRYVLLKIQRWWCASALLEGYQRPFTSAEPVSLHHALQSCGPEIFSNIEEDWDPSLGNYLGEHSCEFPPGRYCKGLFLQALSIIALRHDGAQNSGIALNSGKSGKKMKKKLQGEPMCVIAINDFKICLYSC